MRYDEKSGVNVFSQDDYGHVDKDAEIKALKASNDLFAKTILGCRWKDVLDAHLTSTSAEDVDKMVACVNLYLTPRYLEKLPILKQVDLSPEKIFGFSFRERPESVKARLSGNIRWPFGRSVGELDFESSSGRDMADLDLAFDGIDFSDLDSSKVDYDF